jgi:small subunit ribosomal protein S16
MVKLRLRRKGRIHHPVYDIVAVDSKARRDGAFLERLGYYDPNTSPTTISVDHDRAIYWLSVGAQPTDVTEKLLSYDGVLLRKALSFKNKPIEEINEAVEKHRKNVHDRYFRQKDKRSQRKAAKIAAEKKAKEKAAEGGE